MKKILSNKYLLLILRMILGFTFIYTGTQKIADPEGFAMAISNYRLLPLWMINFIAITLPWLELISALLLVFGLYIKDNSIIILLLLLLFNIVIGISLIRGLNIDCGCYGNGMKIGLLKLSENFLMILGSILLIIFQSDIFSLKSE